MNSGQERRFVSAFCVLPPSGIKHASTEFCPKVICRRPRAPYVSVFACSERPAQSDEGGRPASPARQGPTAAPSGYSFKTRLREETTAPFRKVRQFVWLGSAMSAAVGAFVSSLRVVAALSGVRGTQPLAESATNVGIDLAAIAFFAWAWKAEENAATARLERMRRGAAIAALSVEDPVSGKVLKLSEFRGRSRVVIVAAPREELARCMAEAQAQRELLSSCRIVVAPLEIDGSAGAASPSDGQASERDIRGSWVARPVDGRNWQSWFAAERALGSKTDVSDDKVWVIILRLNGKVGSRSLGAPKWEQLASDRRVDLHDVDKEAVGDKA